MLFTPQRPRIQIKSRSELDGMRAAGRLAAECLQMLCDAVKPGISTQDLDDMSMAFAEKHGARPAPLGYGKTHDRIAFPRSICTSVNEVICHGIPAKDHILREGDIIGIDVTLVVDGFHGDTCSTVPVGAVDDDTARLMQVTLESLKRGIEVVRDDARLGDIGHAIQSYVEPQGFSVVRDFVGHGIGRKFHEPPQVEHHGRAGRGTRLRSGMTFTIEPMVNAGTWRCRLLDDQWTAVTTDGLKSAQYEHTLAVTPRGFEIMTVQNDDGSWEPPGRVDLPTVDA